MRCQYCGKRLPLFRKLKDGEFCSAAHREQFHAQADQLAVAALREQRERTMRAASNAPPVTRPLVSGAVVPAAAAPAAVVAAPVFQESVFQERAFREPELVGVSGSARGDVPTRTEQASFCHRYLVSTLNALPLGQLARVPLEPMSVRQQFLMPERNATSSALGSTRRIRQGGSLVSGETAVRGLAADQILSALNNYGAPSSTGNAPAGAAPHVASSLSSPPLGSLASGFVRHVRPAAPGLMACAPVELEICPANAGETIPLPPAVWSLLAATTQGVHIPRLKMGLQLEAASDVLAGEEESEPEAAPVAPPAPVAQLVPFPPSEELLEGSGTTERVRRPAVRGLPSPVLWRPLAGLTLADLESRDFDQNAVLPVAHQAPIATVGARVRFPALVPVFRAEPVRLRPGLKLAKSAGSVCWLRTLTPVEVSTFPASKVGAIRVLTPQVLLAEAHAAFADRLLITGELTDLLAPVIQAPVIQAVALAPALAPRCRVPWRFEAQNVTSIRTLAIRHLAMDVKMRLPARPTVRVGPRRAEQQLRLNVLLRPARFEFAAGTDSVNFHLEPKLVQPRLRVRPDPARQGGTARSKGKNHADAAISSIKIPVLRRFWAHAPADIRWVALIIPLVFFLAWYSWTPNGKALNKQAERADLAVDTSGVQTVFASFKSRISSRAAVELSEDFRTGLADWQGSRQDWAENWSYDQAGFVRPGNLALFKPTVGLSDYSFEFLGQIENRALSWVYRAKDARNYYLGRLVITRGGPVPEVSLVRSLVKNGRESKQRLTVLTMNLRTDTIYRVRVDVNGSDFTTSVLGQVVDTFTDGSHPQGGIGFYGGRGETSRIRWVEVSHQYDTLGRLCAMLVPYELAGASAPVKADGPATF